MSYTNSQYFLPGGATAYAPNGNVVYLNDAVLKKLKFVQLQPVTWTVYVPGSTDTKQLTFPSGTITFPVANLFLNKQNGKVYIEVDSEGGKYTMRTLFTKQNFDLTPLNTLPTVEQSNKDAQTKSDEANYTKDLEGKGIFSPERILFSIFGANWKRYALITGIGIAVLIARKHLLRLFK